MLRTETCRQYSGRMAVILRPESSGHIFGHIHQLISDSDTLGEFDCEEIDQA